MRRLFRKITRNIYPQRSISPLSAPISTKIKFYDTISTLIFFSRKIDKNWLGSSSSFGLNKHYFDSLKMKIDIWILTLIIWILRMKTRKVPKNAKKGTENNLTFYAWTIFLLFNMSSLTSRKYIIYRISGLNLQYYEWEEYSGK